MRRAGSERSWPDPAIAGALSELRRRQPLTHCITNFVAMELTANVLLAVGASPAMVVAPEEVAEFVPLASALLVNVGTVTAESAEAMRKAVATANDCETPWVLDPVAVGPLGLRTSLSRELLGQRPAIIRGNPSEVLALAGQSSGGRGVDSVEGASDALPAANELAEASGAVVAISGAVDHVSDGEQLVTIPGGDEMLTRVTATGCALGALMAALLGADQSALDAAVAASAILAAAAERAAGRTKGPGAFKVALLDELFLLGRV